MHALTRGKNSRGRQREEDNNNLDTSVLVVADRPKRRHQIEEDNQPDDIDSESESSRARKERIERQNLARERFEKDKEKIVEKKETHTERKFNWADEADKEEEEENIEEDRHQEKEEIQEEEEYQEEEEEEEQEARHQQHPAVEIQQQHQEEEEDENSEEEQENNPPALYMADQAVRTNNLKAVLELIKPFTGKSSEVQNWINNWNAVIPLTGLEGDQQIPQFVAKLAGAAQSWYQRLPRHQPVEPDEDEEEEPDPVPWTIEALKEALLAKFKHPHAQFKTVIDMMSMEQGKRTVEEYADQLENAITLADPDMKEANKIATFIKGLNPDIKRKMVKQPPTESMTEAISNAISIEDGLKIAKGPASINFMEQDNSATILAIMLDKMNKMEMEIKKNYGNEDKPREKETRTCYYCKKPGHLAKDCWSRNGNPSRGRGEYSYYKDQGRGKFNRYDRRGSYYESEDEYTPRRNYWNQQTRDFGHQGRSRERDRDQDMNSDRNRYWNQERSRSRGRYQDQQRDQDRYRNQDDRRDSNPNDKDIKRDDHVIKSRSQERRKEVNTLEVKHGEEDTTPVYMMVQLYDKEIQMLIDTGASLSLIKGYLFDKLELKEKNVQ